MSPPLPPVAEWLARHPEIAQAELADAAGISRGFCSQIATGKRGVSPEVGRRLAVASEKLLRDKGFFRERGTGRGRPLKAEAIVMFAPEDRAA
jgi:transcriptional regulator with XRE-family HTH domain